MVKCLHRSLCYPTGHSLSNQEGAVYSHPFYLIANAHCILVHFPQFDVLLPCLPVSCVGACIWLSENPSPDSISSTGFIFNVFLISPNHPRGRIQGGFEDLTKQLSGRIYPSCRIHKHSSSFILHSS